MMLGSPGSSEWPRAAAADYSIQALCFLPCRVQKLLFPAYAETASVSDLEVEVQWGPKAGPEKEGERGSER